MVAKSLAIISVTLALVGFLVLGAGTAIGGPSQDEHEASEVETPSEPIRLSGLVTLNGKVAPPGVAMSVLSEEILCGNTTTQQGGRFEVLLGDGCPAGTKVTFRLVAVELDEHPERVTLIEMGQDVTIAFEDLDTSDLLAVGVLTEPEAVEDAVADVVAAAETTAAAAKDLENAQGGDPVLTNAMILTIVIIAVVGAFVVLSLLAKLKFLGRAIGVDFRQEVQALILIVILAAILLLGMSGKMPPQGITAVLSLIAGFALGQYASAASGASGAGGAGGAGGTGGTGGASGASGPSGATGATGE